MCSKSVNEVVQSCMSSLASQYSSRSGMFHSSLRREQQQCKLRELPLPLKVVSFSLCHDSKLCLAKVNVCMLYELIAGLGNKMV